MKNLSRRAFLGAGALACTSALAACGSYDNSGAQSQSQSSSASSSSDSSETTHIDFCLDYTPNTNHTGIYVAQKKGWFADEGLDVSIIQPADDTAEALIGSGQAQMGVSYQDYIANALASDNPLPIQAVAAIIQHNTSGIKQVMEADGGDFSKLKMVAYSVDDEVSGLKANMFDCVWVYEGWAVQNAAVQDYPVNYFSFISMDPVFDFYTPVLAANNDFCKENPDTVAAFVRAAKKGYEYAIENPDEAADILLEEVPELDSALVKKSQTYLAGQYQADASSWGIIDADRWAAYFQWLNDNDLVTNKLDVNAGWTMDYLEA